MIHKQRAALAIAAGLGMLATFMPWIEMPSGPFATSIPGSQGDGWITFMLFAVALIPALANDRAKPLAGGPLLAFAGVGVACLALGAVKVSNFQSSMSPLVNNPMGPAALGPAWEAVAAIRIGVGLYLVITAGLAVALLPFLFREAAPEPPPVAPATPPREEAK